jgi:ABC-type Fe3+ transport system permease subunit
MLALIAAASVGWPGAFVACRVAAGVAGGRDVASALAVDAGLLGKTVGIAAGIAAAATVIGWCAAWAGRGLGARWFVLMMLPLLLPSYLISSGWGLLRAPGTRLGDWLSAPGREALVIPAGYGLALLGMVLWAWPLAALLVSAILRRTDPDVFESLRMEPVGRWRYFGAVAWMTRGGLGAAFGAVLLVMLGSAVPLQIAQLDTYAIKLWLKLDETGGAEHWRVWAAAWPLMAVAVLAGWFITTRLEAESAAGSRGGEAPTATGVRWAMVATGLVWMAAVAAPVIMFVMNLRGVKTLETFWRVTWRPLLGSAEIAGATAAIAAGIAGAMWMALAGCAGARLIGRVCLMVMLVAGLTPGVLIGSATAHAWRSGAWMSAVADSSAVVVLAHVARFGFVAALAGWWLARTEPRELRDLRRLEAGSSLKGWLRGSMASQAGALGAAAIAVGMLSLHEIEAAVMLQPASSSGGGFAWVMLQQLHFARTQELAAGMVYVIAGGLGMALVVVWLAGRRGAAGNGRPVRSGVSETK